MFKIFKKEEGGIGELLQVAYPLIISTASHTIMQFINRVFLSRYSADALAACVPAGVMSFTFLCFFQGTTSYTNAFVAQYYGKGKSASVSVAVWQGVWLGLLSGLALFVLTPVGLYFIGNSDHAPAVKILEKQYFLILNSGGMLWTINAALASFFTGRGRTKVTMAVTMAGNAACVLLSWLLVFGNGPVPELGIRGAAIAAVVSQFIMMLFYISLIFSRDNRKKYRTARLVGIHKGLFMRLIKYGAPNGVGFFLDVSSFAVFIFMIGNLDKYSLAANNILVSINMIAFMPVIGLGMATLALAGRYIGEDKRDVSEKVVWNAVKVSVCYVACMSVLFVTMPGMFVNIFGSASSADFAPILEASRHLMKLLAVFILFDAVGIVLADALRGAGDTKFQMIAGSMLAWLVFVPVTWYLVNIAHARLVYIWCGALLYVVLLALIFALRYRTGYWRTLNILKA